MIGRRALAFCLDLFLQALLLVVTGAPGQRLAGLAVLGHNGTKPTLGQATIRYVTGGLLPLALPIVVGAIALASWDARHEARRPALEVPHGQLAVPIASARAYDEWDRTGRRVRPWVEALPVLLFGAELGVMALWATIHPRDSAWHDQLAGTVVVRRGAI